MIKKRILLKNIILFHFFFLIHSLVYAENFQTGDIIFHISRSEQSLAIQAATHSPYSHMGMIVNKEGKTWVLEAIQPVKYTPLDSWIKRGENQHYVVKRYISNLSYDQKIKLIKEAEYYLGKPYDIYFEWDDRAIYCSEIIWKAYNKALGIQLAPLQQLKQFDLNSTTVKALMKQRYGNNIPFNEKVIPPSAIYDSTLLKEIYRK